MAVTPLKSVYRPTHDEAARQRFVGALKGFLNGPLESRLAEHYDRVIEPAYVDKHGRKPQDRNEGTEAFADDHLFQLWGSSVFASQDLMWESLNQTCSRLLPEFEARRQALAGGATRGSLELDDALTPPDPIRQVEIHRQPGGYFGRPGDTSLRQGMDYLGTGELYMAAKGISEVGRAGEPGMGRFLLGAMHRRFPDLEPAKILDLGCGAGIQTIAYREAFPEAELWGVDLSAPFLKFAHVWAEDQGLAIHYRQADARHTGFPDASFDLIITHILFHETWHDVLPGIMREAHRLLKPGGLFFNGDTPYQPARLSIPKQVTNHWQVVNNGEPFWTGYADTDMRQALIDGGFQPDQVFTEYEPLGAGETYVFGGIKR
ncbi:MAG: class I SAM-dependent methyltransferase [Pseudomonadota bacterium]